MVHDDDAERPVSKVAPECGLSPPQGYRYCLKGALVRGERIFPAATRTPGGWRVSRRALREFLERLTAAARQVDTPSGRSGAGVSSPSTRNKASAAHTAADRALELAGL